MLLWVIEVIKKKNNGAGAGKTRIFKGVVGGFKVKKSPTQLFLYMSSVIPNATLVKFVHK